MSHLYELERFVLRLIFNYVHGSEKILDVGCGKGIWSHLIRSRNGCERVHIIGIDIFKPYLRLCRKFNLYDDLLLCHACFLPFRGEVFDVVLASEIIEHLTKDEGLRMLNELERVSIGRVIITCPQGYEPRKGKSVNVEEHRSAWYASELKRKGYHVFGIGCRIVKYAFTKDWLFGVLLYLCTPISYLIPEFGGFLVAYKDILRNNNVRRGINKNEL